MIRNERQYRITVLQRKHLAEALDALTLSPADVVAQDLSDQAELKAELERASLTGQIAELDAQLREFEALSTGTVGTYDDPDPADEYK